MTSGLVTDASVSSPATPINSPIEPNIKISQAAAGAAASADARTGFASVNSGVSLEPAVPASPAAVLPAVDDKENFKTEEAYPDSTTSPYVVQRDFAYYLYSGNNSREQQYSHAATVLPTVDSGMEPVLADVEEKRFQANVLVSAPLEPATHVFFYPEPVYNSFGLASSSSVDLDVTDCSSLLNLPGNDARRRVEAALEAVEEERQRQEYSSAGIKVDRDPLLTPPSSNPESPVSSPDLALDLAIPPRETLILPPRKRSKMILQSMESEYRNNNGLIAASQRQNSVIQFARAS